MDLGPYLYLFMAFVNRAHSQCANSSVFITTYAFAPYFTRRLCGLWHKKISCLDFSAWCNRLRVLPRSWTKSLIYITETHVFCVLLNRSSYHKCAFVVCICVNFTNLLVYTTQVIFCKRYSRACAGDPIEFKLATQVGLCYYTYTPNFCEYRPSW